MFAVACINKILLVAIKLSIYIFCPLIQLGVLLFFKSIKTPQNRICDTLTNSDNNTESHKKHRKKHRKPKLKRGITGSGSITSTGSGDVVDHASQNNNNNYNIRDNENEKVNDDADCCSDNCDSEVTSGEEQEEGDDMQESKPILVEPIDFESFVQKNKTLIQNDPQRELLMYPSDDVSEVVLPKKFRTLSSNIPTISKKSSVNGANGNATNGDSSSNNSSSSSSKEQLGHLFTRQALYTYETANHVIQYKYNEFSGTCYDMPNRIQDQLKEEVYEVDADPDRIDEQMTRSQADSITKKGYLLKGPDTNSDRMFAHIGSKSFKRRYCYLRQEIDGTYILELHKDEKQLEAKNTIVMDFCTEVVLNPKKGRFCFELRMSDGNKPVFLAAEDEQELEDWLKKLQSVIQQNKLSEEKRSGSLERTIPTSPNNTSFGTLKGLDQSMNPQLMKYGRETDMTIAQARKENRKHLFFSVPYSKKSIQKEPELQPYKEQFGQRMIFKCESLKFKLLAPFDNENEKTGQLEPYFTSVALFDAKAGRKLTENFYFDINQSEIRELQNTVSKDGVDIPEMKSITVDKEWVMYPRQAVVSVTNPHPDVFIVVRIEKILQGPIPQCAEPYIKIGKDPKTGLKLRKAVAQTAQKIGQYRMPFAICMRPLFRLYSSDLDPNIDFPAIYRQETQKLRDEDILKLLSEYRKPDKFSKLTVIPGSLRIAVEPLFNETPNNSLTTTLAPIKPFPMPVAAEPSIEICEFLGATDKDVYPFTTFVNHLYVYPLALNFENQKLFSRARNIAVLIELRENDSEKAVALPCIYGRPGQTQKLVTQISCPVLHHNTNPIWYEEIKIRLPLVITAQHHILFSFVHVSCNIGKKKDSDPVESSVGFAWIPLLNKGRLNLDEQCIPVATTLPPGYLSIQPLGLGKGQNAGPEIQWIDNQRPVFTVNFKLYSTVQTTDQHLHNLFAHAEKLLENTRLSVLPAESETTKILKAAHAINVSSVITYLPTILNQLFILLVSTTGEDIGMNIIRLLVNLIHIVTEEAKRKELIDSYVKFVFRVSPVKGSGKNKEIATVHGELCRHLPTLLNPNNTDFLLVNKFMRYSNVFFEIIVKSMAQFLINSGRIKMHRNERFSQEYLTRIENLFKTLVPYLIQRHKDLPDETKQLNKSLSVFVKRCLTLMDRGFVFKLIRLYMNQYKPGDTRALQEFKFNFLKEVCSHEHYVQLNLPFLLSPSNRAPDLLQHFCLSNEFCRQHFLAGLLLQEIKSSLNEISHVRKLALQILKELLAKHDLDSRYQNKGQMERIALLYVPWLGIVLENLHRITVDVTHKRKNDSISTNRMSCSSSYVFARESTSPGQNGISNGTAAPTRTSTPKSKRQTSLVIEHPHSSPLRASMVLKDGAYLAAIAGQTNKLPNGQSNNSLNSTSDGSSTISQDTTVVKNGHAENGNHLQNGRPTHNRSVSVTQHTNIPRNDKFIEPEVKDMLICFIFIVKHLNQDHMISWWHNCTERETVEFFSVLDQCLLSFRYVGKKAIEIELEMENDSGKLERRAKASTLPARVVPPGSDQSLNSTQFDGGAGTLNINQRENLLEEQTKLQRALNESNLAVEVGLVVLDCMGLYCVQFKDSMLESTVLPKVANVYLRFLQLGQSETLSKHVFAALRAFINNFSPALFKGNAMLCGQLVYELLKCCDSRLTELRHEACAVLYLLMRSNFEFSGRKGLTRVHLQVIISVSQMIGNVIGLNNARFQESLSVINSYASSDKAMKGTGFPMEVKDLTRRVRTVLMATAQMQSHQQDQERLLELQQSLANSYASTPELRHTWLVSMARNHEQNGNLSEAAMCHLHIAALMSEYLKLKGGGFITWGAEKFEKISRNIPRDEKGFKLDSGGQDSQYTEQVLLDQLRDCADYLDRSERYETLGELYKQIIVILEHRRDYHSLTQCYEHLAQAYNKVIDIQKTGRRFLGRFYRVIFFGQLYFEEESGIEYIYKEPKVTALSEISERLCRQYKEKLGADVVKMIMDSNTVDVSELDPKLAYIQVTHVTPYFCKDELEHRQTEFEQNHDVDTFMYETPFTKNGAARGNIEDQYKRRTILTTEYSFPYVLKRIPVKDRQFIELEPIEVAIDEMQSKVCELEEVVVSPIDIKKLQLRLQGAIAVQVNSGPLSYASAFLDANNSEVYPLVKINELKDVFRDFIRICHIALQINGRCISADQVNYQTALQENFQTLCDALSILFGENVGPIDESTNNAHRNSLALFSSISGAPNNSSTA
uniref:CSON007578 protein n=2 Tax=Culicoides sonorensis TaxID=179676 RepID=A0A336LXY2_CULSO